MKKIVSTLLLMLSIVSSIWAEFRFPKPEFNDGYVIPELKVEMPQGLWFEWLSILILVAMLILSYYAIFKWRSRKVLTVLLVSSVLFFGFIRHGCICAVGAIQNVAAAMGAVEFPISIFTVIIFFLPIILALFVGRVFCGSACPLGAIQELFLLKSVRVNPILDRVLRVIPPLFLGLAVVFAYFDLDFLICRFDPFVALFRFDLHVNTLLFAGAFLLLSTFIGRPYCRYLCPYGFILKVATFFSKRKLSIAPENRECINCHLCVNSCPVDAIKLPKPKKYSEEVNVSAKKVQRLFMLLPLFMAAGLLLGGYLANYISSFDYHVQLLNKIESQQLDDAVVAFVSSEQSMISLIEEVMVRKSRYFNAMLIYGAWCGLVICCSIIGVYKRRVNLIYEIDKYNCVNCLRCYDYCPLKNSDKSKEV